ncbi:ABC transporter permease subunit [Sutterella wadsworthensis]|uniref:ABC transporter permease subunit n=1 Tax=Sutterella wadsworthensis TaxID=40545 RepID=UPI002671D86E|nr:ABC transporter permease subunit [Sutterella wadsworthensis]
MTTASSGSTLLAGVSAFLTGAGTDERRHYRVLYGAVMIFFALFLGVPLALIFGQSILEKGTLTAANWLSVVMRPGFWSMMANSFAVSTAAAAVATLLGFFAAYGLVISQLPAWVKKAVRILMLLPLFLPSITYGFAVIYSFGRMGLISQFFGPPPFSIYGFWGLLIADVAYLLPPVFLIISNAFIYVDPRYAIVSRVMGDGFLRRFWTSALRPVAGACVSAFMLGFFLAFTDFGIPISIAGQYDVVATELYSTMMGAVPDFGRGAVVAISMMVPAVGAVALLRWSEKLNFRSTDIVRPMLMPSAARDGAFLLFYAGLAAVLLCIFAVMFIVPFVENWPYKPNFTIQHFIDILGEDDIGGIYLRSIGVAAASAAIGTFISFAAALIQARSKLPRVCRSAMDGLVMMTSTLPGMVIGVGFLFAFSGTILQNTIAILILANLVHFFASPYLMGTAALSRMNAGWETTGLLMGDTWIQTIRRVVLPNARATLIEMFELYFINSMVTISAVVFLCGTSTMLLTTKIKEFSYYERFDAIFVLSLLVFVTNVAAKLILDKLAECSRTDQKAGSTRS